MKPRTEVRLQHALAVVLVAAYAAMGGFFLIGSLLLGLVVWVTFENHYRLGRRDEYDDQREFERRRKAEADELVRQMERDITQWLKDTAEKRAMLVPNRGYGEKN